MALFFDRRHAGRLLAAELVSYSACGDLRVVAVPRGGVPVAYEVATRLMAPLDVFVVRKVGVPGHRGLAMGAVAAGGVPIINDELVEALGISRRQIEQATDAEARDIAHWERIYRGTRAPLPVSGKTLVVIDDGLVTGATMRAAIQALRQQAPARLIGAFPVAAPGTYAELSLEADEVVCVATPQRFRSVGIWYKDFTETTDAEVHRLLEAAHYAETSRQVAPRASRLR